MDFDQLKLEAQDRLSRGIGVARRLPGWVWAIPATLVVGFAWAVALCWQPGTKDEASVTVRSIDRQPAATVSIDPTPAGDYIPDSARPSRRRTRRKKKQPAEVAVAHAAPKQNEPSVTPITPEAHWMETISAPKEVGALKRRSEPASDSGGSTTGGGAGTSGGTGNAGGDTGKSTE